jgi:hypothetical protein
MRQGGRDLQLALGLIILQRPLAILLTSSLSLSVRETRLREDVEDRKLLFS